MSDRVDYMEIAPVGEVEVVRSRRRRTMGIQVMPDCRVVLRVPYRVRDRDVVTMVGQKQDWILKVLERNQGAFVAPEDQYCDGGEVCYLGTIRTIRMCAGVRSVALDGLDLIVPEVPDWERCRKKIYAWYRKRADDVIGDRVEIWAAETGLVPETIRYKFLTSRWGSCSVEKNVNFNIRLLAFPMWVIDYVVIHELCHLKHMNHSRKFWGLVGKYCPDYRKAVRVLKTEALQYGI